MNTNTDNENERSHSHLESPQQYNIQSLLYVTSLIASGLALLPSSIFLSTTVICIWGVCFWTIRNGFLPKNPILALIAITILVLLFLPTTHVIRPYHLHISCSNNLRQLGLAMLNYESAYREFPEAARMRSGQLMSWRVAILPYIEQDAIYNQYDFSKPWDSPANLPIAEQAIDGFECPCDFQSPKTPYKLVTGKGTAFDGISPPTLAKITDGLHNTIIIIEDHSDFVYWSQPEDIDIEKAVEDICSLKPEDCIHRWHGFFYDTCFAMNVCFADGSVGIIGCNADPDLLRSVFLCNDGKPVAIKNRTIGDKVYIKHWDRIITAFIYGILIVLPAGFLLKKSKP